MTTTFFDFIKMGLEDGCESRLGLGIPILVSSPKETKPSNSGCKPTIPVAIAFHANTWLLSGELIFINLMFSKLQAMIWKTGIQPAKTPKQRAEKFTKFTGSHSEAIL